MIEFSTFRILMPGKTRCIKTLLGLTLFIFLRHSTNLIAQGQGFQTTQMQEVWSANGGTSQVPGIQLAWTLGESFSGTVLESGHCYTIGFHQPFLSLSVGIREDKISESGIVVYPNPFNDHLNIRLGNSMESLRILITDLQGKAVFERCQDQVQSLTTCLIPSFPAGHYYIHFFDSRDQIMQSFTLIKSN